MTAAVWFYVLKRDDPADSQAVDIGSPQSYFLTDHPPVIGDLMSLPGGSYRVVDRRWSPSAYGSPNWPHGPRQTAPEHLDVMLGPAEEFFSFPPPSLPAREASVRGTQPDPEEG